MSRLIMTLARGLLWLEPLILASITFALWLPAPGHFDGFWLVSLLVPLGIARWLCLGHVLTRTPLDPYFVGLLTLGIINVYAAPYTAGVLVLARPLLGMATYYSLVERARVSGLRGPIQVMIMLSLLVGLQALGSTEWHPKSAALRVFTDVLPKVQSVSNAPGFNANEIAGGMIWLLPLMAGVAIYRWQKRAVRWDVTLAFLVLLLAVLLGQSRSAIAGLVIALSLITVLLLRGRWRIAGWALVIAIIVLEIALFTDRVPTSGDNADQLESVAVRLQIWNSAVSIIRDHPVSGVGLAMFSHPDVRDQYPVPAYSPGIVPHTHNEYLQITTDMGIPGLLLLLSLYLATARMVIRAWRVGDDEIRTLGVAAGAGLLAHAIFGLTDAITLWDRFGFIFWLMLGMAGAAHDCAHMQKSSDPGHFSAPFN